MLFVYLIRIFYQLINLSSLKQQNQHKVLGYSMTETLFNFPRWPPSQKLLIWKSTDYRASYNNRRWYEGGAGPVEAIKLYAIAVALLRWFLFDKQEQQHVLKALLFCCSTTAGGRHADVSQNHDDIPTEFQ